MKAWCVALIVLAAATPLALADDTVVHDACVAATTALAYETCAGTASGNAQVSVYPTQVTIACVERNHGATECTYAPRYHAELDGALAGEWVLRATHAVRDLISGDIVPGSERTLVCRADLASAGCSVEEAAPSITARIMTSAFSWEASWALALVDPTGAEHVTATGEASCTIAQYYPC